MDANALTKRHGLIYGWCRLRRPTRPQASRLECVVDQLLCQNLEELVLAEASDIAASPRVEKPRVKNAHTQQRHVDPHEPVAGNELMIELEVVLPAPMTAVDL